MLNRYDELRADLKETAREQDALGKRVDPTHALQRVAHLEQMVAALVWTLSQALEELAKRDAT